MSFVSYAQNFEDVVLWRALRHVENGCYIDVGAQHPLIDSVSRAFYMRGWRGVHVEPVAEYAELLRQDRPDETVLEMAFSDTDGSLTLHQMAGLSTVSSEQADAHELQHGIESQLVQVPVASMRNALAWLNGRDVHWLKIDVEGWEEHVLRGWDSTVLRPWIIVVEATLPLSTEQRYEGADRILQAADYRFVYFDGLNRFYVAAEHPELVESLQIPPNVFDDATLSGTASNSWCSALLSRHAQDMEAVNEQVRSAASELGEAHRLLGENVQRAEIAQASLRAIRRALRIHLVEAGRKQRVLETEQARLNDSLAQASIQLKDLRNEAAASAEHLTQQRASAVDLERERDWLVVETHDLHRRLQAALMRADAAQWDAQALRSSTSWRVTAPLRAAGAMKRRASSPQAWSHTPALLKRTARRALTGLAASLQHYPGLRGGVVSLVRTVPWLDRKLRNAVTAPAQGQGAPSAGQTEPSVVIRPEDVSLSPDAQRLYRRLMARRARDQGAGH